MSEKVELSSRLLYTKVFDLGRYVFYFYLAAFREERGNVALIRPEDFNFF